MSESATSLPLSSSCTLQNVLSFRQRRRQRRLVFAPVGYVSSRRPVVASVSLHLWSPGRRVRPSVVSSLFISSVFTTTIDSRTNDVQARLRQLIVTTFNISHDHETVSAEIQLIDDDHDDAKGDDYVTVSSTIHNSRRRRQHRRRLHQRVTIAAAIFTA